MRRWPGNINGPFGQSGSLEFKTIATATHTISEADALAELRVTGACTITLPTGPGTPTPGFFTSIARMGVGAVTFVAGPGATVLSAGGLLSIAGQYQAVTVGVEPDGSWLIIGALA